MPELAEVEYYRTRWNEGLRQRVTRVLVHEKKRIFRGSDPREIERTLSGAMLLGSDPRGRRAEDRI